MFKRHNIFSLRYTAEYSSSIRDEDTEMREVGELAESSCSGDREKGGKQSTCVIEIDEGGYACSRAERQIQAKRKLADKSGRGSV